MISFGVMRGGDILTTFGGVQEGLDALFPSVNSGRYSLSVLCQRREVTDP